MKITLDASIKEHREIAELFGVLVCPDNNCFVEWIDGLEYRACNKITIDLATAKIDLRMAIGTDINLLYRDYYGEDEFWSLSYSDNKKFTLYKELLEGEDHKIKLCTGYLKRIGVEVVE
jgi:hypothetical protein